MSNHVVRVMASAIDYHVYFQVESEGLIRDYHYGIGAKHQVVITKGNMDWCEDNRVELGEHSCTLCTTTIHRWSLRKPHCLFEKIVELPEGQSLHDLALQAGQEFGNEPTDYKLFTHNCRTYVWYFLTVKLGFEEDEIRNEFRSAGIALGIPGLGHDFILETDAAAGLVIQELEEDLCCG